MVAELREQLQSTVRERDTLRLATQARHVRLVSPRATLGLCGRACHISYQEAVKRTRKNKTTCLDSQPIVSLKPRVRGVCVWGGGAGARGAGAQCVLRRQAARRGTAAAAARAELGAAARAQAAHARRAGPAA